jgi:uncharacterized iron-regulated membrane protein
MRAGFVLPVMLAGLVLATVGSWTVLAAGPGDREAAAAAAMKVSLTQAIATAEQQTGGKAYDAGVDVDGDKTQIVVETNGPKGVQTVMIDGASGQVVGGHSGGEED